MATTVKIRVTTTAGAPSSTAGMVQKELVVNSTDGTISFLNTAGTAVIKLTEATCQHTLI